SRWISAVEAAGYHALPARDADASQRRQREQRKALWRLGVAGFCMMQVMMYAWPGYIATLGDMTSDVAQLLRWASWVLTLPVMLFSCSPFFRNAWRDVRQRRISMDFPVAVGMLVTFIVSSAVTFDPDGPLGHVVYFDSLTMFVFFLLAGRWFELRLRDRTAGALEALLNRLPDSVDRQGPDGRFERVAVRRLGLGDVIRVLPGEGFPADGEVLVGETLVDEALLTGESAPVAHGPGSQVIAGSHNLAAAVQVRVQRLGAATRFAEIVALMERASLDKPRLAVLADRIARPFLLAVLAAAALSAAFWWHVEPAKALMVGVAVLIVTCPCALSLATPVAMLAAAGALARQGVLVRNLQGLEALASVDTVVFDKTGTLTCDGMAVEQIRTREGLDRNLVLALARGLAATSLHPVSRAVARATGPDAAAFTSVREMSGQGLQGECGMAGVQGPVRLGSAAWCGLPVDHDALDAHRTRVYLADGQGWLATFDLSEDVRPEARATVAELQAAGLDIYLLSGDRQSAVLSVADAVGIRVAQGDCGPADKLQRMQDAQRQGHRLAMVGDGLNDGPVLAGADVSFAFGNAVPLARARSDFVVLGTQLSRIPQAIALARRTMAVVRQNLFWAAAYNAICVPLAVVGWLPAWLAGLGMATSSLLVVLNAARLSLVRPSARSH
ncbi:MAG: heavy metal translocating P-type ATPase, partial [Curvibacter sp.]|nr:heavy metal translocating P-type ATPase [Curvibacter sp.]